MKNTMIPSSKSTQSSVAASSVTSRNKKKNIMARKRERGGGGEDGGGRGAGSDCNYGTHRGIEENTLAILENSSSATFHHLLVDRLAFLEAVRSASLVPDNGTAPTNKMFEAAFRILKDEDSLDLVVGSYELLSELNKMEPKMTNTMLNKDEEDLINAHRKQVEDTIDIVREEMNLLVQIDQPVTRRLDEWVKLEQLDLDSVETVVDEKVEDKDENDGFILDEDGEALILTDGTGFVSEDLAPMCP